MKNTTSPSWKPTLWIAAVLVCACAPPKPASQQQLRNRAAFDLRCPIQYVQLFPLDERTKGVAGCGRQLTYVEDCDGDRDLCTWMLDAPPDTVSYGPSAPTSLPPQRPPLVTPLPATPQPTGSGESQVPTSGRDFGF